MRPAGRSAPAAARRVLPTALAAAAVLGSYVAVRTDAADRLDGHIETVLARPSPRRGDVPLAAATDLGSSFGLAGVAVSLAATGHRRLAAEVAAAGGAAWVLAQAVKPALGRSRPYQRGTAPRLVSPPAGSSWPSGHAAVAAAAATVFACSVGRRAGWWAAAGAGAVGASRVAVGVHHSSDVVAGWGVGVVAAEAAAGAQRLGSRWCSSLRSLRRR